MLVTRQRDGRAKQSFICVETRLCHTSVITLIASQVIPSATPGQRSPHFSSFVFKTSARCQHWRCLLTPALDCWVSFFKRIISRRTVSSGRKNNITNIETAEMCCNRYFNINLSTKSWLTPLYSGLHWKCTVTEAKRTYKITNKQTGPFSNHKMSIHLPPMRSRNELSPTETRWFIFLIALSDVLLCLCRFCPCVTGSLRSALFHTWNCSTVGRFNRTAMYILSDFSPGNPETVGICSKIGTFHLSQSVPPGHL